LFLPMESVHENLWLSASKCNTFDPG
jgi:hypothetical protein